MAWQAAAHGERLSELRRQLERWSSPGLPAAKEIARTGLAELDALLPAGGLKRGSCVEWLSAGEGGGVATLGLWIGNNLRGADRLLVVVDRARVFFAPAALAWEAPADRMLMVHPANEREELWALEQSLRSPAVGVVCAWMDRMSDRVYRRLQLAAEAGGAVGMWIRPAQFRDQPSWAAVRLLVTPAIRQQTEASGRTGRRLRVSLVRCRGSAAGQQVDVSVDESTGRVCMASELGDPTTVLRNA